MRLISRIKRSLLASFFLIPCTSEAGQPSFLALSMAEQVQLSSLLHFQGGYPKITDPAFLLSGQDAGLREEFELNLAAYSNAERRQKYACRFPARALWLSRYLDEADRPSFEHCEGLSEYLRQVPVTAISLVYASENILSPSSFMGHSFIKLKDSADRRAHAVSYFTEVEGFNLPMIMFEALVTGKEGYFIVSPYEEAKRYYKDIEGRNVYEYTLDLDDFERELIRLHLWELKDKQIDYYFHTNNCATLTLDILSLSQPALLNYSEEWLTPLDVLKYVNETDMVGSVSISPSLGWKVRAFGENLAYDEKEMLKQSLVSGKAPTFLKSDVDDSMRWLFRQEYQQALNEWLYSEQKIDSARYEKNRAEISGQSRQGENYELDLSDYKNPVYRAADSQLVVGGRFRKSDGNALISWLPASHLKLDDNRNAFSESALQLLKGTLGVSNEHLYLDEMVLYGIESYIPYDPVIGGLSGRFRLLWERGGYESYAIKRRFHVDAALGVAASRTAGMLNYVTLGSGLSVSTDEIWLGPQLEAGSFLYLYNDSKLSLRYRLTFNDLNNKEFIHGAEAVNTYHFGDYAVDVGLSFAGNEHFSEPQALINVRRFY